jgi:MinD-like ATPase involved in chromosome partitioning or flagellar assembly
MAREDRKIIDLDEAVGCLDDICGLMLSTLNSLPAMITRNPSERRRIEDIIYQAQSRLATKCAEKTKVLVTGQEDTVAEDDDQ